MNDTEIGIGSEIWFPVLGAGGEFLFKFGHETLVCRFGEPAFFIQQAKHANLLKWRNNATTVSEHKKN